MKSNRIVGIPKEIKPLEKRVGLIPSAVKCLTEKGIPVLIQQGAGLPSGFSDAEYLASGAEIVSDAPSIYGRAGLVQKVKEPLPPEFLLLHDQILFCFLHLASPENSRLREALLKSGCTAIGFETVEVEKEGRLPLLRPMSEIAGALAAAYAAYFQSHELVRGGKISYPSDLRAALARIAGFYPDFSKKLRIGKIVIFGGGIVGASALRAALQMQGEVAVVERNEERREDLKNLTPHVFLPGEIPETVLENADILMGCVHSRGQRAIRVLEEACLSRISRKKKKIILDVAIDQGGNFPEARSTTYEDPLYLDSKGNIRFAVPNIPSFCGRAASQALSEVSLPYTEALAGDWEEALRRFPELKRGINVEKGEMKIQWQ